MASSAGKFELHISQESLLPIGLRPPSANLQWYKIGLLTHCNEVTAGSGTMGMQLTKEKAGVRVKLP